MKSEYLLFLLFPFFFVGMWVFVCFLLSLFGGWSRLAEAYRARAEFRGKKRYLQSGRLGLTNYNSVLTVGANEEGLYLAVMPLFRVGHPSLFIPWYDITTTEHQGWMFAYLDFTFTKAPSVKLRLLRKVGEKLIMMKDESPYKLF